MLLVPAFWPAIGTAIAGVLLFGAAPYLPSLFPPSFVRLVGFGAICAAMAPLWAMTESWQQPLALGGASLVLMLAIHTIQTRTKCPPSGAQDAGDVQAPAVDPLVEPAAGAAETAPADSELISK
ncbi:MAG: hypothetical protein ACYDBB_21190 [Armatimonadota bacterium]